MKRPSLIGVMVAACLVVQSTSGDEFGQSQFVDKGLSAFEFILGNWKLTEYYAHGEGEPIVVNTARIQATAVMNGKGIQVTSLHPSDDPSSFFAGMSLYTLHPTTGKIVGMSNNTLGNRKFLDGEFIDGKLVFRNYGELFGGASGYNLFTYHNIQENSYQFSMTRCPEEANTCFENTYYYEAQRIR